MNSADNKTLQFFDENAEMLKKKILESPDIVSLSGTTYYVASDGNDNNSGTDELHPWETLEKVSHTLLHRGDSVRLRRGDIFRGQLLCQSGVTYAAYGYGSKPCIYGWDKNLADESLWECIDEKHHIYRMKDRILDCGTLVFNEGEKHSYKLIPSFLNGHFVCRDDENKPFIISSEMKNNLDMFCECTSIMTTQMSHGKTWPVPDVRNGASGYLYLRCDEGNPGVVFSSIEALPGRNAIVVGANNDVTIDNLCIKYCGAHAIGAVGNLISGLHVSNCEIGWIGGTVQHYLGTDPNYPEGTRGSVTRFGNGIEIYGGCENFICENNYIYQVYDAGITHQYTVSDGEECHMNNIRYTGNLIENCVYSIEYFLSHTSGTASLINNLEIDHNFLRFSGYGWGQQRHNIWTPAHIKSWNFENPARNYSIHNNVFDRAKYRLLHLCCESKDDYPYIDSNTYIQILGHSLGQFGTINTGIPPILSFFETSEDDIKKTVGDLNYTAFYVD